MHHVLLLLSLLAPTQPKPVMPVPIEGLVQAGEYRAKRGDGDKAIPLLEQALADPTLTDPLRLRVQRALGLAYLESKKPADAIPHLEKAIEADKSDEKTWQLLGMAYDGAERFADAIATYKRAVIALPKSSTLHHELGMALLESAGEPGATAEAADVLVTASRLAENDPDIHIDAAYALSAAGKFMQARDHAATAVSLAAQDADAFYNLGLAENGMGNTKAAKQALAQAISLDEMHVPALLQLGFLSLADEDARASGDLMTAIKSFTRILQIDRDHARARAGLTSALAKLPLDHPKMEELVSLAAKGDPKNPAVLALQGEILWKKNNRQQAIKKYEAALREKPDDEKLKARLQEMKTAAKKS